MGLPTIKNNAIVDKIKTRLEAIAAGADYYYTLDDVFDNKPNLADVYANSTNTKVANIRDTFYEKTGEASESSKQIYDIVMTVEIDLIYKGSDAAVIIRKMDADVQKAIAQDLYWDALAFDTNYVSSQRNRMDAYGRVISDLTLTINIQYRKDAWSV